MKTYLAALAILVVAVALVALGVFLGRITAPDTGYRACDPNSEIYISKNGEVDVIPKCEER